MIAFDYQPEYGADFVRLYRARQLFNLEAEVIRASHGCPISPPAKFAPDWFGTTLGESLFLAARRLEWTFDLGLGALGYLEEV